VRRQMQHAFGCDYRGARVHAGTQSHVLNKTPNAIAFTTGEDIFFRNWAYDPSSREGRELLAHELTHVVQQGGVAVQGKLTLGAADDPYEREADFVAREVAAGLEASNSTSSPVQHKCACGGQAGSGGECAECRQKRELAAQRGQPMSALGRRLQRQDDGSSDGGGGPGTNVLEQNGGSTTGG
jgi:hypothetical protein